MGGEAGVVGEVKGREGVRGAMVGGHLVGVAWLGVEGVGGVVKGVGGVVKGVGGVA